jgi:hypothetical protein
MGQNIALLYERRRKSYGIAIEDDEKRLFTTAGSC